MVRMSAAEALMWAVEKDPALRSDFCNLTIVDGPLDVARLRAKVEHAVVAIPRLGQRVVTPPLRLAAPQWADDPDLDLDYHVRHARVPGEGTMRDLLDAAGALSETPFDRARPLWEFTVFDGLSGGRSAMLQKLHHTITDGVGGLRLSLEIVDLRTDPPAPVDASEEVDAAPDHDTVTPFTVTRDALVDVATRPLHAARAAAGGALGFVSDPRRVPQRVGEAFALAGSLHRQVVVTERARSDVIDDRSLRRFFETLIIEMPALRAAATALGGSINDAFVTAVAGALGRYHEASGSTITELRMAMPVSTRARGDVAANSFVPSRVLVPIQPLHDVAARFAQTHDRLDATKREPALGSAEGLAGLALGLPTAMLVALTRGQTRTIDFAASNLRGSPVPLYLAGRRIIASYPFGPRTGCALNATLLSYCDELHIGLNIDPMAFAEPELLVDMLRDSFAELCAFA